MDMERILKQMTLEDKKYGIPSLCMCDGPHGLRKQADVAVLLKM